MRLVSLCVPAWIVARPLVRVNVNRRRTGVSEKLAARNTAYTATRFAIYAIFQRERGTVPTVPLVTEWDTTQIYSVTVKIMSMPSAAWLPTGQ